MKEDEARMQGKGIRGSMREESKRISDGNEQVISLAISHGSMQRLCEW